MIAKTWLDPGAFGTLGVGAGFALGAKLCRPEAEVWALFGDGALGYSIAEFDTFVRHGVPIIAVVGNDAGWTQIAREQVPILMFSPSLPRGEIGIRRTFADIGESIAHWLGIAPGPHGKSFL